ncbi:hypothetical protein PB01_07260 [Psychrobacillus glaciei]|uniref:DNA mismatch repair proteins mutS family domain-containing protein n=1 Tax=Psychrobacillus glaciei TaxID=2283160 RepID=A0A5J6SL37_9BACI|nr:hypothetical protein [Psychrobacillus glaciei]QFF98646.1 hypothetical protein PB01_07260 [Psychrobacillus glaciei]
MNNSLLILILVVILFIAYQLLMKKKKKLNRFREEWESGEFLARSEDHQSVSMYWENKKNRETIYDGIDQLTWDDLAMDTVFKKINYTQSSVGSEYLFNQLRDINPFFEDIQNKEELYKLLANDQALREEILHILSGLGKQNYTDSSSFFYEDRKYNIKYVAVYKLLALLPFASIFLMFYSLKFGILSLVVSFLINTIIYYKNKTALENELYSTAYIASIIHAGKRFSSVKHLKFTTFANEFKDKVQPIKKILVLNNIISLGKGSKGDFDAIYEYIRILFLLDFISNNNIIKTISNHKDEYRELWQRIGQLDAGIAVAFYRKSLVSYCIPEFVEREELSFENMSHPLIKDPVTNTTILGKCTLITGSNASGKSTYIKAIAINAILAQTINTVLAENWTMKPSYIVTSMVIQDNVLDGDSYLIAEIKSLKRIIRLCEQGKPCISFIDEILKGTNTIERIAASAAMMEWLSSNKGMNIIASHDIELTEMARKVYANYHFSESIENGTVQFDYTIHSGPSKTRNAIKLLGILDYPESITKKANGLAEYFTERREWEEMKAIDVIY